MKILDANKKVTQLVLKHKLKIHYSMYGNEEYFSVPPREFH